jgi:Sec-independent protein secretion pathway component TatC
MEFDTIAFVLTIILYLSFLFGLPIFVGYYIYAHVLAPNTFWEKTAAFLISALASFAVFYLISQISATLVVVLN